MNRQILSKKYLAIQRDGDELIGIYRGKTKLTHLVGPLYSAKIGLTNLRKLGYAIVYCRRFQKYPLTDYFLYRVNLLTSGIIKGFKNTTGRGISKQLPPTRNLCIQLVLRQTPKEGVNLNLFSHVYRIVSIFLTEDGEILDVKMEMDFDRNLMRVIP